MTSITSLVFLCITALVVADKQCSVEFDKASSQLTLKMDTSMLSKTGPPGPRGPPGTVSKDMLKKMEDKIASLESQVKELKEKVGTEVNQRNDKKINSSMFKPQIYPCGIGILSEQ